jgi:hypothetical protein
MTPHPSATAAGTAIPTPATATVRIEVPWTLLADVSHRWPGYSLSEKVCNALVLACAWHDHGDDDDASA